MDCNYFLVDSRIKRFVEGCLLGKENELINIRLIDIDESFMFDNYKDAQDFLNEQTNERVYDKELRKGYFKYTDEYGTVHKYTINKVVRGKIVDFTETVA